MPANVVIDASVLVSAFLFPGSVPGQVLKLAEQGAFTLHLSPTLLDETMDALVSSRLMEAYGHDRETVVLWCDALRRTATVFLDPLPDIGSICRDPDDDHVIAVAIAVSAETLVTGDKDLSSLGQHQAVRIVTARAYLSETLPEP